MMKLGGGLLVAAAAVVVIWWAKAGTSSQAPARFIHVRCPRVPAIQLTTKLPPAVARFYELSYTARQALDAGDLAKADALAEELLAAAPQFGPQDWNYGNAIFHGHMIRGLVALRRGNLVDARRRLLASAETPGSPQLETFGPSMALASALLERGDSVTVLAFLEGCKRFWAEAGDHLEEWQAAIRAKRPPDFSPNVCL